MSNVSIASEIGWLETVILHRPGPEVEAMTPQAAHDALYDDIIALERAQREHDQLAATLRQFGTVLSMRALLAETLAFPAARAAIVEGLCELYGCAPLVAELDDLPTEALADQLLRGTPQRPTSLATFLAEDRYALPPMYNLFFMRDAAMCIGEQVVIGAMASRARGGEALLLRALFQHHPALQPAGFLWDGTARHPAGATIEGGDVLPLRDDLLLVGLSERTSIAGIDTLLERLAEGGRVRHVIVQPIPKARPFIHLDMVFTLLDRDLCLIHEPVIRGREASPPILFELDGKRPPRVHRHPDLLGLLTELGMALTPVLTGGRDPLRQAREQWQKGTNFFAMAPGKVIGYARNQATFRELEAHGFRVVPGCEVLAGRVDLTAPGRVAVAMEGAELSRGGGGGRCMTLPVRRKALALP